MGTASYEQLGVTEEQLVFITNRSLINTPVNPRTYDLYRTQSLSVVFFIYRNNICTGLYIIQWVGCEMKFSEKNSSAVLKTETRACFGT